MDKNKLKSDLHLQFMNEPQKEAMGVAAIEAIDAGIGDLAKLGLVFDLVPGSVTAKPAQEFPKMVYDAKGAELIVADADAEGKAKAGGFASRVPHAEPVKEPTKGNEPVKGKS